LCVESFTPLSYERRSLVIVRVLLAAWLIGTVTQAP